MKILIVNAYLGKNKNEKFKQFEKIIKEVISKSWNLFIFLFIFFLYR